MRESNIKLQRVAALLGPALLIPAGLAGILAGILGLGQVEGNAQNALVVLQDLTTIVLPWCMPLACLLFGLGMTAVAAAWLARGLQSSLR
jgi:hypothetical protein